MILKLFLFLGVQVLPLLFGYRLKVVGHAQESWGRPLSRFIIVVMNTSVVLMGTWRLHLIWSEVGGLLLTSLLFGLVLTGIALSMSRLHPADRGSQGGYIIGTVISNFGFTMAGFVCLMLYGLQGISLQTIYIYPLVLLIYLLWFPVARTYGTSETQISLGRSALLAFTSINSLPILGTMTGVVLNTTGVPFPDICGAYVLPIFVYGGTMLSTFTVGITLQPHSVLNYLRENASISVSKFVFAPLLGGGLAWLIGLRGLPLAVVLVCSSAPVGLFSNFAASIFGLNRNLTNSLFLINTAFYLLVVLPLLFYLLPHYVYPQVAP